MAIQVFNVSVNWGGVAAKGLHESHTISLPTETTKTAEGIRGEAVMLISRSSIADVTIRINKNSPTIEAWLALYKTQQSYPIIIKRNGGFDSVFYAQEARLVKIPDDEISLENTHLEFVFKCINSEYTAKAS